jgi:hypothetical protein
VLIPRGRIRHPFPYWPIHNFWLYLQLVAASL